MRRADSRVLVVAGEASGDAMGAALLDALQQRMPGVWARGMGGDALRAAGLDVVEDLEGANVMGGIEAVGRLGRALRAYRVLCAEVRLWAPQVAVLIDYPEFNLALARVLKRAGVPVVYYVSPQVWAWRRGRVARIARLVDHMLVIFPFETKIYERAGVPVTLVGHPALDTIPPSPARVVSHAGSAEPARVAMLPGSRSFEVDALLPVMLDAAECLETHCPRAVSFVIARAPTVGYRRVAEMVASRGIRVEISAAGAPQVLARADAAMVASGTATIQAAALGVPMVILYRTGWTTYWVGRLLVSPLPGIGMVNILAGRRIVPEQVQRLDPGRIASRVELFLTHPGHADRTRAELERVAGRLRLGGAARRAASVVASFLDGAASPVAGTWNFEQRTGA